MPNVEMLLCLKETIQQRDVELREEQHQGLGYDHMIHRTFEWRRE